MAGVFSAAPQSGASGHAARPLRPGQFRGAEACPPWRESLFACRFLHYARRSGGTQLKPEKKGDLPPLQPIGFCLLSENSTDQRPEAVPFPKLICSAAQYRRQQELIGGRVRFERAPKARVGTPCFDL